MRTLAVLSLCVLTGCVTHAPSARLHPAAPLAQGVPTKETPLAVTVVETRYEIAGYRDPADPAVWHEPHSILRATVVPGRASLSGAASGPLMAYVPASYAPLPPSAELAAVLEEQREITAELRAMKASMFSLQDQAQTQFGKLLAETSAADRLRQQLAAEQARLKQQLAGSSATPNTSTPNW